MEREKLKILVINYEYPPIGGGGGIICRDIAEEIASMGHDITVITSMFDSLKKEEICNGVNIIRVPVLFRDKQNVASLASMISYFPSSCRYAGKLISKKKFDVINTHFAIPSGPTGNLISKKFNIPNVLSIHGGDIFDPSKSLSPHKTFGLKQVVRRMLLNADRVVAQSSDTKNNALKFYNLSRNIDVIPLGIKEHKYNFKSRTELNIPEDKKIFITVGRLIKRKNLGELVDIFSEIKKEFDCSLLIVGDGPEKENLQQKINSMDLSDDIRLLGHIEEELKFQYLNASDIYLSTALHEGFGIVFLEALESGLPIICYNRGGQVDFLRDSETGYLVELSDKKLFTEKLRSLINNSNLIEKMSIHNKELIKKFYITNIAGQYISLFKEIIQ